MVKQTGVALMAAFVALAGVFAPMGGASAGEDGLTRKHVEMPVYPRGAERRGIEGYVVVKFTVTPEGQVADINVVESSPEGVFDEAAVQAVEKWTFEPVPAPVAVDGQKVTFKL
ncbi:MAG: energy transducer TonB [Alphaproteobacteria bacterium]|nr:energy transducer TonB [Alphaproteobacteria bacterium]